jgi:hypothetical protein
MVPNGGIVDELPPLELDDVAAALRFPADAVAERVFEVAWASLLGETKGFARPVPTIGFVLTLSRAELLGAAHDLVEGVRIGEVLLEGAAVHADLVGVLNLLAIEERAVDPLRSIPAGGNHIRRHVCHLADD